MSLKIHQNICCADFLAYFSWMFEFGAVQKCASLTEFKTCCETNTSMYLIAKIGFDTSEKEPSTTWQINFDFETINTNMDLMLDTKLRRHEARRYGARKLADQVLDVDFELLPLRRPHLREARRVVRDWTTPLRHLCLDEGLGGGGS